MKALRGGAMIKRTIVSLTCVLLSVSALWGGGWNNTLMGCRAIAIGGAFTGLADDPSAIFYNPAGLIYQSEDLNFSIDGFYVWPTHEYTTPWGTTEQSSYPTAIPQIFLSYRTNDRVTIGFGVYAPYATGGVDWKADQLGYPFKSYLGVLSFTPTIAYKISEKLSIGLNLNYYHSVMEVNTEDPYEGSVKTEESGSAFSMSFGVMYVPSEKLRIGLSLRGKTKMKLTGYTSLPVNVPDFGSMMLDFASETNFIIPWDIELGFSYRFSQSFLLSVSAQYTIWSDLQKVEKTIKNIPMQGDLKVDEEMNFKDILILRTGVEYVLPVGLSLRAGIGLDRAATPSDYLNPSNIDVDKFTLLGGIGYRTGKARIDFTFVRAMGKEREATRTIGGFPLSEKYNLSATVIGLGVTFAF
jgi:long-chain fatty acid transport protein